MSNSTSTTGFETTGLVDRNLIGRWAQVSQTIADQLQRCGDSILTPRNIQLAIWIVIAVGIALRVSQLAIDRSLFLDEAFVATNIRDRGFLELLKPLEFDQRAPAGFLFAVKSAWELLGDHDWVLRLVPLFSGIASIFVFRSLAAKLLSPTGQLLANVMFVLAVPQIFYSSDLKQYSTDVLFALLSMRLVISSDMKTRSLAHALRLGLFGMVALCCSFPAVFVLGSAGLILVAERVLSPRHFGLKELFVAFTLWGVGFLAIYLLQCRHFDPDPSWKDLWSEAFLKSPIISLQAWQWAADRLFHVVSNPAGIGPSVLSCFLFLYGATRLGWRRPLQFAFVLGPVGAAFFAAVLNVYPFGGRVILFTAPLIILTVCYGVQELRRLQHDWIFAIAIFCTLILMQLRQEPDSCWFYVAIAGTIIVVAQRIAPHIFQHSNRIATAATTLAATTFLLVMPAKASFEHVSSRISYKNPMFWDYKIQDLKPVLAHIRENWRDGDKIYLYSQTFVAFEFYAERYGFREGDWVRGIHAGLALPSHDQIVQDLAQLDGHPRVWVLFTHVWVTNDVNERDLYVQKLDSMGTCMDAFVLPERYDAAGYLYDLSSPPHVARLTNSKETK